MERRDTQRYGGSNGGESSQASSRRQPSQSSSHYRDSADSFRVNPRDGGSIRYTAMQLEQPPANASNHISTLDMNRRAQSFLEEYRIHKDIKSATYNIGVWGKEFIPETSLRGIWQHQLVEFLEIIVGKLGRNEIDFIWNNLLVIISILVSINWNEWHRFYIAFIEPMRDSRRCRLDEAIPFDFEVLCDKSFLGDHHGKIFWNSQLVFRPIVIEQGKVKEYPRWRPLPFIQNECKWLGEGNYGEVMKEAIAPYQYLLGGQETPKTSKQYIARKLMKVPGDFQKERDNLLKLKSSLSNHEHIIQYLAIIIIGEPNEAKEYNILMPLATMNLKVFLEQDPSLAPAFKLKDLLLQAANLAHAIHWLHAGLNIKDRVFMCCHMDLTLVNFLVFLDGANKDEPVGKWKVADFGISTLQELETEQRSTSIRRTDSLTVQSTDRTLALLTARTARMDAARPPGPFQAPEVSRGSNVGRASDIWSYGCILFQILARGVGPGTETLCKLDLLRGFEEDGKTKHPTDYFYRERAAERYLNPHVSDWLKKSLANGSYPDRQYVQECKKLISNMLRIDHAIRPKAHQVNSALWKIIRGPHETPSILQPPSATPPLPGPPIGQVIEPVPRISVTPAPPDPSSGESSNHLHDTDRGLTSATIDLESGDNQTPPRLSATRSQSVAESITSLISVESVTSDSTPFSSVSNVIQSLISPTGNIVFVTMKAIYVRGIRLDSRFHTIKTDNFEWERGSIAGDYVTMVGYIKEQGCTSRTTRAYRLYQLSSKGVLVEPRSYQVLNLRGDVDDVIVSPQLNLIIKRAEDAQLYLNHNHSLQNLTVRPGIPPQGIYFGAAGNHAFVKISLGSNLFQIGVWRIADLQYIDYLYQRERRESTAPLVVIPFPSSPCCILWDEYDKLWFLRPEDTREGWVDAYPTTQEDRLQAVAVSPDEKFVVIITGITAWRPKSKLSVKSLSIENERFIVGSTITSCTLKHPLRHPNESAVLVQAVYDVRLTVIIAHNNGKYEEIII